jgi:hypothetical protein
MEIGMLKKFASSFILASALVGTMVAPSLASDDTFKNIIGFPVKVIGSGVATVVGVPMGAVKDGVKGSIKSTKWASGKMGSEDSGISCFFGSIIGGPVGFVGGGAYGCFDGAVHGAKTGYSKPFSHDAFTFKDE